MGFREHKRQARLALHERLSELMLYRASPTADPVSVTVRLHPRGVANGELLRGGYAESREIVPQAIFLVDEITPVRGAVLVTKDSGVWRVDNELPQDDPTITAEVVRVSDSQLVSWGLDPKAEFAGLPLPA